VKNEAESGRLGNTLVAVIAEGNRQRLYLSPDDKHIEAARSAIRPDIIDLSLPTHPQYVGVRGYGFETFGDLFTPRQIITLACFTDTIEDIRKEILADSLIKGICDDGTPLGQGGSGARAYAEAVTVYLALAIDKLADYNNSLCGWSNTNENIVHLFNRHALPMIWDFVEANPFGSMLDFCSIVKSVSSGISSCVKSEEGYAFQADAAVSPLKVDQIIVSTDPPYYDNVPYADISDFFYVWLRRSLKSVFPDVFATLSVPKSDEMVADRVRHGDPETAEAFFLERMKMAINRITKLSSIEFPFTIFYAFKQSEIETGGVSSTGWSTFLQSIMDAGCTIVATWPVRTESQTRKRAVDSNALANSVVIVCRRRAVSAEVVSRAEFIRSLKRELPPAIAELQAANIAPADMPQSAIGPGMSVFSRYKVVLESDDSPMSVKTALQLINRELDEYLGGIQGEFDADTRFAITWFEQHGMAKGDYGSADSIARARGISVESVKHAGIIESSAGKVRILSRDELDDDWQPGGDEHLTVWECLQHLVHQHEKDGISHGTAVLLKKIDAKAEAVKDLAYCLYDICANKRKDAKDATAYNALIADWTELTRQAAAIHDTSGNRQSRLDV
jgi:putative DNA methylase